MYSENVSTGISKGVLLCSGSTSKQISGLFSDRDISFVESVQVPKEICYVSKVERTTRCCIQDH